MTRRPESLGWKLSAILQSLHQVHEVETWSEHGSARNVRIDEKAAPQVSLARIARVLWLVPLMDRLWVEGAEGRRRFLDRMVLSFEPSHAEMSLAYEKAMRERNRLLKDQVRDPGWYGALEKQMAETGSDIHAARLRTLDRLTEAQNGAATAFPTAELELVQTEGEMPSSAQDLRDALSENRFRDIAAGRTLVGPHRADLYGRWRADG